MFRSLSIVVCLLCYSIFCDTHSNARAAISLKDSVTLTLEASEALFIQNNLQLIAEQLNIQIADGAIINARLWPNPEFTLDNANLWNYKEQLESGKRVGPIIGKGGNYQQFAVQLELLIETAGKRNKRIKAAVLSKTIAKKAYEILLIDLKYNLRITYIELQQQQALYYILDEQINTTKQFLKSVQTQVAAGNIIKADALRIQSLLIGLQTELTKLVQSINSLEKEMKIYLNLPEPSYIKTTALSSELVQQKLNATSLTNILESLEVNPGLQLVQLETESAAQALSIEKANKMPDLHLMSSYDRGGGIVHNYVGFGVKINLPLFNRNQAGIQSAQLMLTKQQLEQALQQKNKQAQLLTSWENLQVAHAQMLHFDGIFQNDMEEMLATHTAMYKRRAITLYQWVDSYHVWLNHKTSAIEASAAFITAWETLQYETGYTIQ